LDAKKRGFRTVIVSDCTKGVAPDSIEEARKEFHSHGVEYMSSSEVEALFSE
jgi:nicotinamidase-related amidase